jgi:hypothetical protein
MIVSGGKILAIDGVETDWTLSGDGAAAPLGLESSYAEAVRSVSGKLDASAFSDWSAKTESWDIAPYAGGENVSVEDHVISLSGAYELLPGDHVEIVESGHSFVISVSGDFDTYSAGPNVSIEDHVVSGRDWTPEIDERIPSSALAESQYGSYLETYVSEAGLPFVDEQTETLWTSLSGTSFGAERAVSDRFGNLIDQTYLTSASLPSISYCELDPIP